MAKEVAKKSNWRKRRSIQLSEEMAVIKSQGRPGDEDTDCYNGLRELAEISGTLESGKTVPGHSPDGVGGCLAI